jgi:2-polyprenyl-3-methyl-5-hydroxy-6-metoxy-1,4-benzoquinol methylase
LRELRFVKTQPDAQSFDRSARAFVRLRELNAEHDGITPWLLATMPGGSTALDLGCGAGEHAAVLARSYDSVLAVDLSAPMLALAPAIDGVTYAARDLFDVTGEYDLVLTVNTLHHVDVRAALRHIGTLVAPGGTAIVVDCIRRLPVAVWRMPTLRAFSVVDLLRDLRARDAHAWERFRLQNDRHWLGHLRTDRYPTFDEWRAAFDAELPGAEVQEVSRFLAATWRRSS